MVAAPDPHLSFIRPVRSFQPGEDWRWCYLDEQFV
jgi:hypothetical protein